jgi:uncharacterized membrane protein
MLEKIQAIQNAELIIVQDAAIVTWPIGKKSPKTKQLTDLVGVGVLRGAFWGILFGLIFFVPFYGLVVGAAFGALGAKMADYGISDDFIKQTHARLPRALQHFSCLLVMQSKTRSSMS